MAQDFYTDNLGDFGFREIKILSEILNAWVGHGLPEGFDNQGVKPAFNRNSGYVFLINADYQCAMLDGDSLRLFHSLPYGGKEGFLADLMEENKPEDLNADDVEYIRYAPEFEGLVSSGDYPAWEDKEEEAA